jgi:uncharacterized protein YecA (UPF0149 family)
MADNNNKETPEQGNHDHGHVHGPGCNHDHRQEPVVRNSPKIGRNDPCSCNSGKKFKKCCGKAS